MFRLSFTYYYWLQSIYSRQSSSPTNELPTWSSLLLDGVSIRQLK